MVRFPTQAVHGMLEAMRIAEAGVLQECTLCDLGRINVICGKNNSGKSTLLRAIADVQQSPCGSRLDEERVAKMHQATLKSTGWGGQAPHLNDRYLDLLKRTADNRAIWCEADPFGYELQCLHQADSGLMSYEIPYNKVQDFLTQLVGRPASRLLVPPKRRLQLHTEVGGKDPPSPDGTRVLNMLFHLQSQQPGSNEERSYSRLLQAFQDVTGGYRFHVRLETPNDLLLSFSPDGEVWVDGDSCGLGLQDLLTLLYFALEPRHECLLIEEPENHIHPEMQKKLLHFMRKETSKQYILSTHSNVFVNSTYVDRVYLTSLTDGKIQVTDATNRATALHDLGYSVTDNLVSDLVILVEGPTDMPILEEFLVKMGVGGRFDVKMWPLGGDIMDQLDLSVFAESRNVVALVDSDPGSRRVRQKFEKVCADSDIHCTKLKRRAIENYFTVEAIRSVFGDQIPEEFTHVDHRAKLQDQIGFNVKKNNRSIARHMKLEDISGTDLEEFLQEVQAICEGS